MDFSFTSDQIKLREKARAFAETEIAPTIAEELDASYDFHLGGADRIKKSGFYSYVVPEAYGGKGVSSVNLCIVREEFSQNFHFRGRGVHHAGAGQQPHRALRE